MTRYIDAEKVLEHKFNGFEFEKYSKIISDGKSKTDDNIYAFKVGWNEALQAVHDVEPTADVQEVVRCRDCKHRFESMEMKTKDGNTVQFGHYCKATGQIVNDDGFCAWAERRTDNA